MMSLFLQVRGAPAIAIVGSLSVAVELRNQSYSDSAEDVSQLQMFIQSKFDHLKTARPTAVNITEAAEQFKLHVRELASSQTAAPAIQQSLISRMEAMLPLDVTTNKAIGRNGAQNILDNVERDHKVVVLTHCNTGSLATAGYGTALGVIRSLHQSGHLEHVYCTETRPYNQGARLTAYELVHDGIPSTLVCDSMGGLLMKERRVSAVVVGADRVVANGDTANKIGTYQLAIAAKYHGIPFYVAAPMNTVDFRLGSGSEITIEERPSNEMLYISGQRVAAEGIGCWNPAFDVTPAELITGGIITELGVFEAGALPRPPLVSSVNK